MAEMLSVRDVAALLKLSTRQVYKLVACGRMPQPLKVGRSTRWRSADIAAWIDGGCGAAETEQANTGARR